MLNIIWILIWFVLNSQVSSSYSSCDCESPISVVYTPILLGELPSISGQPNEVGVNLRPTVSRPEPMTRFLFSAWRLRVSCCETPYLTRGCVCNLLVQLLLGLARAVTLGSESRGTQDHILLSQFLRLVQSGVSGPCIYIPLEQVGPVIPPGTGFPFLASYDSQGYGGIEVEVEVNLGPTVRRPVRLGVRHPSGTRDQFFFLLKISFRQLRVCYFVAPSLTRGRFCKLL
jgi:hypothetical protein